MPGLLRGKILHPFCSSAQEGVISFIGTQACNFLYTHVYRGYDNACQRHESINMSLTLKCDCQGSLRYRVPIWLQLSWGVPIWLLTLDENCRRWSMQYMYSRALDVGLKGSIIKTRGEDWGLSGSQSIVWGSIEAHLLRHAPHGWQNDQPQSAPVSSVSSNPLQQLSGKRHGRPKSSSPLSDSIIPTAVSWWLSS
jgi:hypothetical protein